MTSRILFIDDEPHMQQLIEQILRQQVGEHAYQLFFAHDGLEALAILQAKPEIEIVVTDIRMPQMDGLTFLTKINELKAKLNPVLTTIILSAYSDMKSIRKAMNYGAFDFLTKPIDLADLKITLHKTIEHVQRLKEVRAQEKLARERKERYQRLFDEAPVALWENNYAAVKLYLDHLRQNGVNDFKSYFAEHPEVVRHCIQVIKITDVNQATLKLYEVAHKQELINNLSFIFRAETEATFTEIFLAITSEQKHLEIETITYTLTGNKIHIALTWLAAGHEAHMYHKVLVSAMDITERKHTAHLLADYNKALAQAVSTRTAELTATNAMLEKEVAKRKKAKGALQRRNRELELLNRVSQMFSSSLQLDQVLKTVLSEIRQMLNIAASSFWLNVPETNELVCQYANGLGSETVIGWRLSKGQGVVAEVAESGETAIVADVLNDPRHYHRVDQAMGITLRSQLSLPIRAQGKILGVLNLVDTEIGRFTLDDLRLVEPIATAAASAIQNARLFTQEHHQRQIAESLREVTLVLNSSLERDTVLGEILTQLRHVVQYNGAGILLQNGTDLVVSRGQVEDKTFIGYHIALSSQDPAARVFRQQQPLIIADVHQDPHWEIWPGVEAVRGWMGVPLLVNQQTIGVLAVDNFKVGAYSEVDAQVLQVFANQAAIAIENARLFAMTRITLNQMKTIYNASVALSSTMDLQRVLELILSELRHVVPYDSASVQAIRDNNTLEIIAGTGFPDLSAIIGITIDITATGYPNGQVIAQRAPIIITNAQDYLGFQIEPHVHSNVRSWMGVPLLFGERLLGMIAIDKHEVNFYTDKYAFVAVSFATQAAIAMENARLYTEAQEARITAEEANKAKSRFIASMSHEFRTPLNGVLGYTQMLKRDKNLTLAQQEYLDIIRNSGEHLLTLINDVLDMSKIEAGKLKLNIEEFRLPVFLKNLTHIVQIRAAEKNINFIYQPYNFTTNEPTHYLPNGVYGDEKCLRQILINLLGNAIKFTDQGEVRFKVGVVNYPPMTYVDQLPKIKLRFQIEDTGIGIAPTELNIIFHPFEQAGDPKHQLEGMGLGLAISYNLVQIMGSKLEVQSQLGGGSIFWFELELPITSQDTPKKITAEGYNVLGVKGEKRKALIVDDDKLNRMLLTSLLSRQGFEITEATSGYDGLHKAYQFKPHVILADLMMPDMDGFEMTRRIRESAELKDTIIIAISANVFPHNRQESLIAGCNAFLPKPIDTHLLFDTLKQFLNLEMVYENSPSSPKKSSHEITSPTYLKTMLTPPPPTELKFLFNLAMIGDVATIQEKATQIAEFNSDYQPFTKEIIQLAKGFQLKKIRELLRIYLD